MAKARLTTPILLGMAFGAGNNQTRTIMGLAIGLMTVRALAVAGYRFAKANRSFQRAFEEIRAGRLDRFSTIPKPSFPRTSLLERILYWLIAFAVAYTLFLFKVDLICMEACLVLIIMGSIIDFSLLTKLKINTRKLAAVAVKINEEVVKIQNGLPNPPKPSFGRALRT